MFYILLLHLVGSFMHSWFRKKVLPTFFTTLAYFLLNSFIFHLQTLLFVAVVLVTPVLILYPYTATLLISKGIVLSCILTVHRCVLPLQLPGLNNWINFDGHDGKLGRQWRQLHFLQGPQVFIYLSFIWGTTYDGSSRTFLLFCASGLKQTCFCKSTKTRSLSMTLTSSRPTTASAQVAFSQSLPGLVQSEEIVTLASVYMGLTWPVSHMTAQDRFSTWYPITLRHITVRVQSKNSFAISQASWSPWTLAVWGALFGEQHFV